MSFNSLEASAKKGGMADPSGLMVVLLLLLSEGLVARWGEGGWIVPVAAKRLKNMCSHTYLSQL